MIWYDIFNLYCNFRSLRCLIFMCKIYKQNNKTKFLSLFNKFRKLLYTNFWIDEQSDPDYNFAPGYDKKIGSVRALKKSMSTVK